MTGTSKKSQKVHSLVTRNGDSETREWSDVWRKTVLVIEVVGVDVTLLSLEVFKNWSNKHLSEMTMSGPSSGAVKSGAGPLWPALLCPWDYFPHLAGGKLAHGDLGCSLGQDSPPSGAVQISFNFLESLGFIQQKHHIHTAYKRRALLWKSYPIILLTALPSLSLPEFISTIRHRSHRTTLHHSPGPPPYFSLSFTFAA